MTLNPVLSSENIRIHKTKVTNASGGKGRKIILDFPFLHVSREEDLRIIRGEARAPLMAMLGKGQLDYIVGIVDIDTVELGAPADHDYVYRCGS